MTNAYYMTGRLDRQYLRIAAVYRCLKRYGVSKQWAVARITERGLKPSEALALVELWLASTWMRDRPVKRDLFNWRG